MNKEEFQSLMMFFIYLFFCRFISLSPRLKRRFRKTEREEEAGDHARKAARGRAVCIEGRASECEAPGWDQEVRGEY